MSFIKKMRKSIKSVVVLVLLTVMIAAATVSSAGLPGKVEIHCDGEVIIVERTSKSIYDLLIANGITIGTYDDVKPSLDHSAQDVDKVVVRRAVNVTLNDEGSVSNYRTSSETVEKFLEAKGIDVNIGDIITPSKDTAVTDGMTISIKRCERVVTEKHIEIPYETERREHPELAKDLISIAKYGEKGQRTVVTETIYYKGEIISQKVLSDKIVKEPVKEIIDVGTKANTVVAPDGSVYTYSKMITCTATAYDASYESNGPWGPITATGKALDSGMVAVDPRVIPLGTKLYIESPDGSWVYGYAVAEDTGGAIKGNKIDLFYHSPSDVRRFGRRKANVYILQ